MGTVLIKVKIMPSSPSTNLKEIENEAKKIIEENQGKNTRFEKEPVAFGINAIIAFFARDEEKDTDALLDFIREIENVSSAEIIDYRRALG